MGMPQDRPTAQWSVVGFWQEVIPMKKRTYRSISVKQVDREKLWEAVENRRVVVGVDVGKEELFAVVTVGPMEPVVRFHWSMLSETRAVVELLRSLGRWVEVVLEPSGTYGDVLRWQLDAVGIAVYRASPKRVHDLAEVFDGVPSLHDQKAPGVVAKMHWDGLNERWSLPNQAERTLRAMVDTRGLYREQIQRALGRLEARLARHWPELGSILDLGSATLLEVLCQIGGPQQVRAWGAEAARFMRRIGGSRLAQEKIDAVLGSARESLGVPLVAEELRALQALTGEIRHQQRQLRGIERRICRVVDRDPEMSWLGATIGKVTAAEMVALGGRPTDYANASSLLKGLGVNLKERSSGKHKGELKITKRGPAPVRQGLYMASLRLLQKDAIVRAWYERKVAREAGRYKKKAVVAVMRKLIKALWWVARGEAFDASKLFDTKRLGLAG